MILNHPVVLVALIMVIHYIKALKVDAITTIVMGIKLMLIDPIVIANFTHYLNYSIMNKVISLLVLVLFLNGCSGDDWKETYEEHPYTKQVKIESSEMTIPLLAVTIDRNDIKDPKLTVDYIKVGQEDIDTYEIYYDYDWKCYGIKVYDIDEKYIGYILDMGYTYSRIWIKSN